MTEFNPLRIDYGYTQGRVQPAANQNLPRDGEYVYLLGTKDQQLDWYRVDDFIRISQAIDLTGVDLLRFDAGLLQPASMPQATYLSGHDNGGSWVYTARLQRGSNLPSAASTDRWLDGYPNYPAVRTRLYGPFITASDSYLRVEVDGGGNQDIHFVVASPTAGYTAHTVFCSNCRSALTSCAGVG